MSTRSRLCRVCGGFHPLGAAWPAPCAAHCGAAANPAPMIRPDNMAPIRSMADGRVYDGRSAYYASVRRAGCEIVGDDRSGFGRAGRPHQKPIGADIKRAIEELRSR
jgi:hypothetical protein